MKVLVGTDFHGKESVFRAFAEKAKQEKVDIITVCGDVTHFGSLQEAQRLLSIFTGLGIPVLFVPGNCDPLSLVKAEIKAATCIHGRNVSFGDLAFIGVGASPPTPFNTPFELAEDEIMETLIQASKNLSPAKWVVLISHSPPFGTKQDETSFGLHVGSSSVRAFIEQTQPSVVFCGHIHEAKGRDRIGRTLVVNPGPARHGDYMIASFEAELSLES